MTFPVSECLGFFTLIKIHYPKFNYVVQMCDYVSLCVIFCTTSLLCYSNVHFNFMICN